MPLSRRLRWPGRILAASAALVALAAAAFWLAVRLGDYPAALLEAHAARSLIVLDATGTTLRQEATSAGLRERWRALDRIAPRLVQATLASEDHAFYRHTGVDWRALGRALWLNLQGGGYGGSTITMQLVRLSANTPRSWRGKLRQMVLAGRLERRCSKRAILEHYLNRVYYGNGAWGVEQAANVYFDKHADALSLGEAALLAVLPRGPRRYDPLRFPRRALARRAHILRLMEQRGYVSADERALAERLPLAFARTRPLFRAPHFVELVKRRLPRSLARGATVRTTLDWDLQRKLEVAHHQHLGRLAARHVSQASLIVLSNRDGAIRALIGSEDFHDAAGGAVDGSSARLRPGSTLKPFVYGTALERGDTPATIAIDLVLPADTHQFYSKDVKSHGFARYREALAGSYNLAAVHTLQRVGLAPVLGKLRAAGLATLDRPDAAYDWGLAIGHAEVRLIDLVAAFTTFARGGRPIAPRAIELASGGDGSRWREPLVERAPVFSPAVAYLVFDMLSDPEARKPMFGDRVPLNLPFPVALKTGTTRAYTDLWAIGVTREFTVGVWAGNFDGSPTHQVMSTEGATPLVRAAFSAIAARYGSPTAPPRPPGVVVAEICPLSGQRPGPFCDQRKRELFRADHVPEARCDWHRFACGRPLIVYPQAVRAWAQRYRGGTPAACGVPRPSGPLRITYPVEGARFVLEPHRPANAQRPPLAALPAGGALKWTIDGEAAEHWLPKPGQHRIEARRGAERDAVTIVYE